MPAWPQIQGGLECSCNINGLKYMAFSLIGDWNHLKVKINFIPGWLQCQGYNAPPAYAYVFNGLNSH